MCIHHIVEQESHERNHKVSANTLQTRGDAGTLGDAGKVLQVKIAVAARVPWQVFFLFF